MYDTKRFITFTDAQGIMHTMRVTDIQAVGIGGKSGKPNSYIRAHDCPLVVSREEATVALERWTKYG